MRHDQEMDGSAHRAWAEVEYQRAVERQLSERIEPRVCADALRRALREVLNDPHGMAEVARGKM